MPLIDAWCDARPVFLSPSTRLRRLRRSPAPFEDLHAWPGDSLDPGHKGPTPQGRFFIADWWIGLRKDNICRAASAQKQHSPHRCRYGRRRISRFQRFLRLSVSDFRVSSSPAPYPGACALATPYQTPEKALFLLWVILMAEQLGPVHSAFHHTVYGRPVGQAAQTAVVYEKVHAQLAGDAGVCEIGNGRPVAVHRVEIKPVIVAKLDSILQKPAFTGCPEYQLVPSSATFSARRRRRDAPCQCRSDVRHGSSKSNKQWSSFFSLFSSPLL